MLIIYSDSQPTACLQVFPQLLALQEDMPCLSMTLPSSLSISHGLSVLLIDDKHRCVRVEVVHLPDTDGGIVQEALSDLLGLRQ